MSVFPLGATRLALALAACAAAAGCSQFNTANTRLISVVTPYRVEVVQGNFVSKEQVAAVQPGMSRQQVRDILGTPLVTSVFHADRWDYVFRYKKGNGEITNSRVSVFFKDNRLARYEGGNLPNEEDYLARIADKPKKASSAKPATPQQAPSAATGPQN